MENLSTEQYAVLISDSLTNGQFRQAVTQFHNACAESVDATALLKDIAYEGVEGETILRLAGAVIEQRI